MFERVAAFDGDSTMIKVLFADETFAGDFLVDVLVFDGDFFADDSVFADDFFADVLTFADEFFDDDSDSAAFFFLAGVLVFAGEMSVDIADSSGSDSNTAFTLFANTFFFASSVFGEDAFLTDEMIITVTENL